MFDATAFIFVLLKVSFTEFCESASSPRFSRPGLCTTFKLLIPLANTFSHYLACFPIDSGLSRIARTAKWSVKIVTL